MTTAKKTTKGLQLVEKYHHRDFVGYVTYYGVCPNI